MCPHSPKSTGSTAAATHRHAVRCEPLHAPHQLLGMTNMSGLPLCGQKDDPSDQPGSTTKVKASIDMRPLVWQRRCFAGMTHIKKHGNAAVHTHVSDATALPSSRVFHATLSCQPNSSGSKVNAQPLPYRKLGGGGEGGGGAELKTWRVG